MALQESTYLLQGHLRYLRLQVGSEKGQSVEVTGNGDVHFIILEPRETFDTPSLDILIDLRLKSCNMNPGGTSYVLIAEM